MRGRKGKIGTLLSFAKVVAKLSREYDVIVLYSLRLLPLAMAIRTARPTARIVLNLHDAPIGMDRLLTRFFLSFTDCTIAISQFVIDHLRIKNAVIVPVPIADIPVPTRTDSDSRPSAQTTLGIVGRIDPDKRIEVAIDAMRFLPARFHLNIYGDPAVADESYMQDLRDRAGDSEQVTFCGYAKVERIYDEIDGVIVCNEREPSGRTVGEAMLRLKLVFAPDSGGAKEHFENLISGFTYRALDAEGLARAVESAFDARQDTSLMRQLGREKMLAERSPRVVAQNYFAALERIANN
ncbi:hypothetical protein MHPYR_280026 [uncultured Mycobacterium sp.]|uniref:Glycosyl transferase family 1 domain-containing protein n=1 Tax=uncultured Mycobacterium sp. TaxID=171292 RepID=A0A1Y5PIX9_9MYCO|nr:hypothetical protein MHPYR_280026 [uncultured Mycobacterium sp.]